MLGLGCMRLSTERDRDERRGIAVIHAALDAGVTFLDTADAYCLDDSETGHNERLVARALSTWNGDRSRITVATKGGLTRPQGQWVPDGRAKHLAAACDASRRALGVDRLDLYLLHAVDPRTPFATSVRALAALRRDGLVARIGLCNVTAGQIEEAQQITVVDAVQVEINLWNDAAVLSGVAAYCRTHGIPLVAHRPLGGPKGVKRADADPLLVEIAGRHHATPHGIALAWLAAWTVPIPGATRVETAAAIARAAATVLSDDDRARLDARFSVAWPGPSDGGSGSQARRTPRTDAEIVLLMGLPAAGKTTVARQLAADGYTRLNRDEARGSLADLLPALTRTVESGASRIVLDNTYVSRQSRARVLRDAAALGVPVRCVWLTTSLEDAQVNACRRMIATHGRLLGPEEMRTAVRRDPNAFAPAVQFRYQRELEPPHPDEGFSRIDVVPFERAPDPGFTNRAVLLWWDDVVVERADVLRRYAADGWTLLALAWRPAIADGTATAADVEAAFARERETLGVAIDVRYCPHGGGPPICWCRKPLPGLAVAFIEQYTLDPSRSVYVGNGPQDPGFARRIGFQYRDAAT